MNNEQRLNDRISTLHVQLCERAERCRAIEARRDAAGGWTNALSLERSTVKAQIRDLETELYALQQAIKI